MLEDVETEEERMYTDASLTKLIYLFILNHSLNMNKSNTRINMVNYSYYRCEYRPIKKEEPGSSSAANQSLENLFKLDEQMVDPENVQMVNRNSSNYSSSGSGVQGEGKTQKPIPMPSCCYCRYSEDHVFKSAKERDDH
jgi:hypothetical protein